MKRNSTNSNASFRNMLSAGAKSIKLMMVLALAGTGIANAQFGAVPGEHDPMVKGLNDPILRNPGGNNMPIRNITITPICPGIQNLNVPDMSFDAVVMEWSNAFNYDSLVFRFALSGTNNYREIRIPGNPNPGRYFLQGLVAQTSYDFSIASVCGPGNQSAWSNSVTVTTLHEPAPRIQNNQRNYNQIRLNPNPANGSTAMSFYSPIDGVYQVLIVSSTGKEVFKRQFNCSMGQNIQQIDLSNFAPGLYFVRLGNGSETSIEKLMVN
jgi:Secretion system C-terminal sorting domain